MTRIARLLHHPLIPLLVLFVANAVVLRLARVLVCVRPMRQPSLCRGPEPGLFVLASTSRVIKAPLGS